MIRTRKELEDERDKLAFVLSEKADQESWDTLSVDAATFSGAVAGFNYAITLMLEREKVLREALEKVFPYIESPYRKRALNALEQVQKLE